MTKIIEGSLELKKDMKFDESIEVHGNIICPDGRKNLTVAGDINAGNIDALNIDAGNIDALNIVAWNIDALNIDARDIDAGNIVCISRKKRSPENKTMAYSIILDRFNRERKEVMPELKSKEAKK